MAYFVLDSAGQAAEVARINARGSAAFYEPVTDSWINDPLLGAEILNAESWRPARPHELPQGIVVDAPDAERSGRRRSRRRRRTGTHAA